MPGPQHPSKPKSESNRSHLGDLEVGDRVAYSRAFLRSIGAFAGDMPHARGEITGLVPVGREVILAEVSWDRAELPARVNVKNLCRIGIRAYHD
jgi:hypothetical protein